MTVSFWVGAAATVFGLALVLVSRGLPTAFVGFVVASFGSILVLGVLGAYVVGVSLTFGSVAVLAVFFAIESRGEPVAVSREWSRLAGNIVLVLVLAGLFAGFVYASYAGLPSVISGVLRPPGVGARFPVGEMGKALFIDYIYAAVIFSVGTLVGLFGVASSFLRKGAGEFESSRG